MRRNRPRRIPAAFVGWAMWLVGRMMSLLRFIGTALIRPSLQTLEDRFMQ